jgi:hypothetical protein
MTTAQASTAPSEALREEHELLLDHAEHIRIAAVELPSLSPEERRELVDRIVSFLNGPFATYAESETRGFYPYVNRLLGDSHATDGVAYDLEAVRQLAGDLQAADIRDTPRLQELLYGAHAVITFHFRKEDDVYLPLLARGRPEQLEHVLGAMREIRFEREYPTRADL